MEEPDTAEPYPIKTSQLNTDKPIPEKRNTDSGIQADTGEIRVLKDGGGALQRSAAQTYFYFSMGEIDLRLLESSPSIGADLLAQRRS